MRKSPFVHARKREQGQTLAIVAFSLVSLFAMAALGIDVASLYSARGEAQRAADAVALAGAKAFVDSGFTTTPNNPDVKTLAESMATGYINAAVSKNNVGGTPPTVQSATFDDTTHPGNPQVTVKVQQTSLPIFFSKIWGVTLLSVSATAVAEAYNPSNSQTDGGSFVASAPSCVKPLVIPNTDKTSGNAYIDPEKGAVTGSFIGEPINLSSQCQPSRGGRRRGGGTTCPTKPASVNAGSYVPIQPMPASPSTPASTPSCPACARGGLPLEQSLECCDMNIYQCGRNNPKASVQITYQGYGDTTTFFSLQECAMKPFGLPADTLDTSNYPTAPMKITANSGPSSGQLVNTSNSIMTFPIFDNSSDPSTGQVTVIGFLQVFVNSVGFTTGQINGTVLNVVGCGDNPSAASPVSGGGASPIPVRLIHN
ncbi:MAG TPA: pilus assembly protein TadG-related protein [Terriglobales bacterium]|jgi:hypothetical protein